MSKSEVKKMFTGFFDSDGIIQWEFVPPDLTINHRFYFGFFWKSMAARSLYEARIAPPAWQPASHTEMSIRELSANKSIAVWKAPFTHQISVRVTSSSLPWTDIIKDLAVIQKVTPVVVNNLNNGSWKCFDSWSQRWNFSGRRTIPKTTTAVQNNINTMLLVNTVSFFNCPASYKHIF
jgi:hypothetical protein